MKFSNFLFFLGISSLAFCSVSFAENPGGGGGCPTDGTEPTVPSIFLPHADLTRFAQNISEAYLNGELPYRVCLAAQAELLLEAQERVSVPKIGR